MSGYRCKNCNAVAKGAPNYCPNCSPTPSDSAITADGVREKLAAAIERHDYYALRDMALSLIADRTKLAANLARVEGERDHAQAIADGRWQDAAKIFVKSMNFSPETGFKFDLQATIVPLIAAHLAETFKAMGGENYVDIEINHEELGPLMLRMQRRWGEQPSTVAMREKARADAAEAKSARLEEALKVPEVWGQTERDGMAAAFDEADGKRGHYETLFAVAAWLLRHRQSIALTLPEPSHEP